MASSYTVKWARKAIGMEDIKSGDEYGRLPAGTKVFNVSPSVYNRIVRGLERLPAAILKWIDQNRKYKFIIKSGNKRLAVNTEGYDYPRYKSQLFIQQ